MNVAKIQRDHMLDPVYADPRSDKLTARRSRALPFEAALDTTLL